MTSDKKYTVADLILSQGDTLLLSRSVLVSLVRGGISHA